MSKLRETFKNIKEPIGSNDYILGGIVDGIRDGIKAGKNVLKGVVESVTDWTGLDAEDWKDIWIGMGANPENADDETIQTLLTAMGLERATTKADDSVVPTIDKVEGFASSNPQSRVSLQQPRDGSSQRFVGENAVNGNDVSTRKIAQINEVLGKDAFTQVAEGPRVGRNINIG